jgi:predicted transcriptional regulator
MDANEKVLSTLKKAGKDLKAAEIAELSGLDRKEVDKAIKKLKAEGKVHSPKVCYFNVK